MESVITTRLPKNLEKDLIIVAKSEDLDKSTVIRRLLARAISEWKKDYFTAQICLDLSGTVPSVAVA